MASVTGSAAYSSGTLEYSSSLSGKSCLHRVRNKEAVRGNAELTINVPVVYMMRENPFRGPLEGVGPKNLDFFGP